MAIRSPTPARGRGGSMRRLTASSTRRYNIVLCIYIYIYMSLHLRIHRWYLHTATTKAPAFLLSTLTFGALTDKSSRVHRGCLPYLVRPDYGFWQVELGISNVAFGGKSSPIEVQVSVIISDHCGTMLRPTSASRSLRKRLLLGLSAP
jgi:hypothetical protein